MNYTSIESLYSTGIVVKKFWKNLNTRSSYREKKILQIFKIDFLGRTEHLQRLAISLIVDVKHSLKKQIRAKK